MSRPRVEDRTGNAEPNHHLRNLARLRRVRDRMDREYMLPLDLDTLAHSVNMSAGHLSRQFRRAYGEPPYAYLMTRRIERAMTLLRHTDLSVTEVCFTVGCSSLGTFSARFAELVGVSPSLYRKQATPPQAVQTGTQVAARLQVTAGIPPCMVRQATRPIRNREASAPTPGDNDRYEPQHSPDVPTAHRP